MVINEALRRGSELLKNVSDSPLFEARLLMSHFCRLSMTDLITNSSRELSKDAVQAFFDAVSKRERSVPMAYITGKQEFYGLDFKVNENVLIPRPDTEVLVEFAINCKSKNILDVCTGSGCIAIAVKKHLSHAVVKGIDISREALETASINSQLNETDVEFEQVDILTEIPRGSYDLILSNPPYITAADMETLMSDVKSYEPHLALFGGDDGLTFYRRICSIAPGILNPRGILAFEIGYNQYDAVFDLMKKDFGNIGCLCDLAGIKRVIFGTLTN